MAKLIKLEAMELPKVYVVGKEIKVKMEDVMGAGNPIPAFWEKCIAEGIFELLGKQSMYAGGDWVGFMTDWSEADGTFIYSCGMMLTEGVAPTAEYTVHEIAPSKVWVSWIQGKDIADVCCNAHCLTGAALKEKGQDLDKIKWTMEVYNCPRFTTADENGEIVLDYYVPVG